MLWVVLLCALAVAFLCRFFLALCRETSQQEILQCRFIVRLPGGPDSTSVGSSEERTVA
jgi:hypothetical protein